MLLSIFRNPAYDLKMKFTLVIFSLVIVTFSLTIHEVCHGLTALALGDRTAQERGRLTLNPLKHLNPMGTIAMLLFGFGWAEPVPVSPVRFKRKINMRAGMAITAVAGPVSNLLISFLAAFGMVLAAKGFYNSGDADSPLYIVWLFFWMLHTMNLSLAVFNFLPVPPLDGSKILFSFLPDRIYWKIMKYEQYIAIALVVLLYFGVLDGPLSFITTGISDGMTSIVEKIVL